MRSTLILLFLGLSFVFHSKADAGILKDKIKSNCSYEALKLQGKAHEVAEAYYAESKLGNKIIADRKAGRPLPSETLESLQEHQQLQVKVLNLSFTHQQCLWDTIKASLGENKTFADLQKNQKAMAEIDALILESQEQLEKIRSSFTDCLKMGTENERRDCEVKRHQSILEAVERRTFLSDLKSAWKNSNENHLKKDLSQYSKERLAKLREDLKLLNDEIVSGTSNRLILAPENDDPYFDNVDPQGIQ